MFAAELQLPYFGQELGSFRQIKSQIRRRYFLQLILYAKCSQAKLWPRSRCDNHLKVSGCQVQKKLNEFVCFGITNAMEIVKHQHHWLCRVSDVINQIIECAGDIEPRGAIDDSPGSPSETRARILNRLYNVSQQCDRAAVPHTKGQPGDGYAFVLQ